MKVVFLLDNKEYVEVAPDKLQIRQIQPGIAALGTEVVVPVNKEDGTLDLNEDGTTKTQVGFRPFINYAVNLTVPTSTPEVTAQPLPAPTAVEVPAVAKKANGKTAKRKAN